MYSVFYCQMRHFIVSVCLCARLPFSIPQLQSLVHVYLFLLQCFFQMKADGRPQSPHTSIPTHLQAAHLQTTPQQPLTVNHQHMPVHQQGTHPQMQGLAKSQGRVIHKPEPLNIHGHMLQVS